MAARASIKGCAGSAVMASGSRPTQAVRLSKLTLAWRTPGWASRRCSTERTQPPHFIPSTSSKSGATGWAAGSRSDGTRAGRAGPRLGTFHASPLNRGAQVRMVRRSSRACRAPLPAQRQLHRQELHGHGGPDPQGAADQPTGQGGLRLLPRWHERPGRRGIRRSVGQLQRSPEAGGGPQRQGLHPLQHGPRVRQQRRARKSARAVRPSPGSQQQDAPGAEQHGGDSPPPGLHRRRAGRNR